MDNTVGSRENLSLKQKEVLIGTLLGDATLELNGRYPRLRIDHSLKQKSYVEWKYKIFQSLTTRKMKYLSRLDSIRMKRYHHCKFDTISTPLLSEYYTKFYPNKQKQIPKNIVRILRSPLSLAVWYMDDGYKRNDCNALRINTDSFSFKEQELLVRCLKQNFMIDSKLHRKGKFWNIYIPSSNSEAEKFCRIVKPYIIPEMEYKISLTP